MGDAAGFSLKFKEEWGGEKFVKKYFLRYFFGSIRKVLGNVRRKACPEVL